MNTAWWRERSHVERAPAGAAEVLQGLPGVVAVRPGTEPGAWVVESERSAVSEDIREAVFRAAVARSWVLLELAAQRASLEDVFVRLTTHDLAAQAHVEEGEVAA